MGLELTTPRSRVVPNRIFEGSLSQPNTCPSVLSAPELLYRQLPSRRRPLCPGGHPDPALPRLCASLRGVTRRFRKGGSQVSVLGNREQHNSSGEKDVRVLTAQRGSAMETLAWPRPPETSWTQHLSPRADACRRGFHNTCHLGKCCPN